MREVFLDQLFEAARRDARIVLVNPDSMGFYCEAFRRELPGQYLNVGIAEQNAIGVAAGLALTGRRPFVFNILAFNSFRCFEQVRLDVCAMNLSVVLAGIGAGVDYGVFGPSHHTMEDVALMRTLPGMTVWSPSDDITAGRLARRSIQDGGPAYIRLNREGRPLIYSNGSTSDLNEGLAVLRQGRDLLLAATGPMVRRAMEVAATLAPSGIDAGVIDVFRLKPFPERRVVELAATYPRIATIEEHFVSGGLGTAVLEALANHGLYRNLRRFGFPEGFQRICGDREHLHRRAGLDAQFLAAQLLTTPS